jgi:xanthine dehydrogenase accessory factor
VACVLVRGTGDIGSAVAHALCLAGHAVVLHDDPRPAHPRRGMAFTDALFEGSAQLESLLAKRAASPSDLQPMIACGRALPVADLPFDKTLRVVEPDVLVDARVRKHDAVVPILGIAPLVIGLGPGFVAGRHADVVIETGWGDELGRVLRAGAARDYAGGPRDLGGHGRERFVYAPARGLFRTEHAIGAAVAEGEEVARIGTLAILAPFAGVLRGLTHDGAQVSVGTKIVEVDARADPRAAFGIGERPRRIAQGVLEALAER